MLRALVRLDVDITAVVTVADDGGSSGRLRREMPTMVPPGDLRMALGALSRDDEDGMLWGRTFQHRFEGSGVLAGHPVGNLLLVGLMEVTGDPVTALDTAAELLHARGRVLPMSRHPLDIVADVTGLDDDPRAVRQIRGQVAVATTPGTVQRIFVEPALAPACPEAVAAIRDADVVTLGPGSWMTSVLPHLLLHDLASALSQTPASRVVVLNLEPQPGETDDFSQEQHLDVLVRYAPDFRIDTVLAHTGAVVLPQRLARAVHRAGAELVVAPVGDPSGAPRHDPVALAAAMAPVIAAAVDRRGGDRAPLAGTPAAAGIGQGQMTSEDEGGPAWR
ncbi:uridine diphosphate-N-acetylglucosamine-binding protein YvcK [Nakamurella deserti]|uniref:gluconeogenesis factor YvcK family protein n=1 Tax=Nakamurella deserti TaxID=2164074 RepID=UPI000DBE8C5A